MTAHLIKDFHYAPREFCDPKLEIIHFALVHMLSLKQLCAACVALAERDVRECAEKEAMARKVGLL